ncbi:hypothetical protein F66182_4720 [Fusarium sp. NRRL 66182]|nr:hypothetical protein F66182_4720 [Fusarium sp. NRRL 66182]
MEESASKRRRTSPRTSLNVGASQEPVSPRRRRPSYASPTTASLARHNPEALARKRSRSPEKLPSARAAARFSFGTSVAESPSETLAARLATSRIVSDAPTPTRPDETTPGSEGSIRRVTGGMASAARRTPSKTGQRPLPAPAQEDEDEDFNPFRGNVLRRSPPRPIPASAPEDAPEEDDINPFRGNVLRRSPPAGVFVQTDAPSAPMPEPELPPPIQASSPPEPPASMPEPALSPAIDEFLVGSEDDLLFPSEESAPPEETSPAKSASIVRSPSPAVSSSPAQALSPIDQPPPAPSPSPVKSPAPAESSPAPEPEPERDSPSPSPPLPDFSPSPPPASMPPPELPPLVQTKSQNAAPSASQPAPRLPPPRDSDLRKSFRNSPIRFRELSQQRDSPLAKPPSRLLEKPRKSFHGAGSAVRVTQEKKPIEVAQEPRQPRPFDPDAAKKKELELVQKEIEALQKDLETAQRENERIRLMQESGRVLAPSNQEAVLDLIQRHLITKDTNASQTPSQQLLQATLNPTALLPFGKAVPSAPSAPVEDKQTEVKSHHPVSMTAEEELPYLELFSPFSISSNISILEKTAELPLRQLHAITFRSREIPGVFTAKVNMTVNATELTVLDLDVKALEPAAKPELGPFVRKICTGDCNRSMQRNVGILTWAMGEWLRVAVERAGFWCQLEQSLGSKDGIAEAASQMRARRPRRRKDADEEEEDENEPTRLESVKKADLIRYMGQQHFDISIPHNDTEESGATLRLEWKTEFDWTGEALSKLSVLVGAPGKWHQTDERGSLGKIPRLFAELVQGEEETERAVRTIVALIAGEQS